MSNVTDFNVFSTYMGFVNLVMSLLVMLTNGVVIIVFFKVRGQDRPTLWVITLVAMFDFLHGLYVCLFEVPSAFLDKFAYSDSVCKPAGCFLVFVLVQNKLNIVFIVVDRYISVKRPLHYPIIASLQNYYVAMLVGFAVNASQLLATLLQEPVFYYNTKMYTCMPYFDIWTAVPSILVSAPALFVILFCFTRIGKECLKNRQRVEEANRNGAREKKVFSKCTLLVGFSIAVFLLPFIPVMSLVLVDTFSHLAMAHPALMGFASFCVVSSSFWNVIVYSATYVPFKYGLLAVFCPTYHRKKRQMEVAVSIATSNDGTTIIHHKRATSESDH